jgi:hypothetical protein
LEILADARGEGVGLKILFETGRIQSELGGVSDQISILESILVLEEVVVHLPEFALRAGRLGSFGGVLGVGVTVGEREIAEYQPHPIAKMILDVDHDWISLEAMRALVVAVFHERDGGGW